MFGFSLHPRVSAWIIRTLSNEVVMNSQKKKQYRWKIRRELGAVHEIRERWMKRSGQFWGIIWSTVSREYSLTWMVPSLLNYNQTHPKRGSSHPIHPMVQNQTQPNWTRPSGTQSRLIHHTKYSKKLSWTSNRWIAEETHRYKRYFEDFGLQSATMIQLHQQFVLKRLMSDVSACIHEIFICGTC
jgi:hypothetical protein